VPIQFGSLLLFPRIFNIHLRSLFIGAYAPARYGAAKWRMVCNIPLRLKAHAHVYFFFENLCRCCILHKVYNAINYLKLQELAVRYFLEVKALILKLTSGVDLAKENLTYKVHEALHKIFNIGTNAAMPIEQLFCHRI
jgi:hypothetical protein